MTQAGPLLQAVVTAMADSLAERPEARRAGAATLDHLASTAPGTRSLGILESVRTV